MAAKLCEVCDYPLDERGCCLSCARATPADLELLKFIDIKWTVCSVHGAHEATSGNKYRAEWTTVNPKDKRKKMTHHEWRFRCTPCMTGGADYRRADMALSFKDRIMLPKEVYQPLIDECLERWRNRR
jgi:hypothetical protein